jgi:hypothetical protein
MGNGVTEWQRASRGSWASTLIDRRDKAFLPAAERTLIDE